jgi:hypothetical protein
MTNTVHSPRQEQALHKHTIQQHRRRSRLLVESRLEGVDRRNLKFTNLSTHYKPELALELKFESEREGKQINQEITQMNMVICFTEVWFQRT